MKVCTQNKL